MTMAADKQDKVLNFSSEREQSGACSSSAEREKNQGKNFLNVPTLRFPEFSGEWKESTIGEEFELYSGNTPSRLDKDNFVGNINWITSGELKDHYIGDTKEKISESSAKENNLRLMPEGTFVIAIYGLEAEGVRSTGSIITKQSTISQACMAFTPKGDISNEFLYSWYKKHGNVIGLRYAQGTKQQNLSYDILEKFKISYPSLKEQDKLNSFISLLDTRIATQNRIIEDLKQLRSAIRNRIFKKIQQEPEQIVQIKEILTYEQPTKYLVSNTEYVNDSSLIPVLTANKAFILGYTFEKQGVYDKGDCIILDDFTLDCKIVDFPFKVKSSAIKILRAKNRNMLRYAFEYLKYLDLETSEHKRHYIAEIEPIDISLPSQEKIEDIIHLFESLDMRIVNAERTWSSYLSQKQFLLQTLFI